MTARKKRPMAILMGDLVASGKAKSPAALHRKFNAGVAAINKSHGDALLSPLTITLGDEFQGVADSLSSAFSIMHEMRLRFLSQDVRCRFVLGYGEIATKLNPDKAWNMMGPGLTQTRAALDDKREPGAYRFVLPGRAVFEAALDTFGYTMTEIESDWSDTQFSYVHFALTNRNKTNLEIAEKFGVSDRNVYKVLRAAKFKLYEKQVETIMMILAHLDGETA